MNCPICGGATRVADSRPNSDSIRRRRECLECKNRFSTVEIDADYYATLKPIDKKAVRKVLYDGFANLTRQLFYLLNIEERNNKDENESDA